MRHFLAANVAAALVATGHKYRADIRRWRGERKALLTFAGVFVTAVTVGVILGDRYGDHPALVRWTVAAGLGVLILDFLATGTMLPGFEPKPHERWALKFVKFAPLLGFTVVTAVLWGISSGSPSGPIDLVRSIAPSLAVVFVLVAALMLSVLFTCLHDKKHGVPKGPDCPRPLEQCTPCSKCPKARETAG